MDISIDRQSDSVLDVLSSEELMNIGGGEMILSNPTTLMYAANAVNFIANSWNTFCSNFSQGYEDHRK
jgi:Na+/H+ antiporter NhaD/arsenite permease-like protein